MAINIDTLVHNEFGGSASRQLEKLLGRPTGQIQSGVERAITEVLDGFSLKAQDETGRQTLYEAARYCDDGLIDDPAVFFGAKEERAALADSNNMLGSLLGGGRRDSIADSVRSASGLNAADADAITGYVTPGVLGVMKRQMLNGAVLDNSDGIGQMLLGDTTTATVGGAASSVDHTVPKTASRQTHTPHAGATSAGSSAGATGASASVGGASVGGGAAVAAASHGNESDMSWLFRWAMPALLLGGLVFAGMRGCGVNTVEPVAVVDTSAQELAAVQTEVDGLKGQVTTLTAERDEALSDRETAVTEIDRLSGELETANAAVPDTSELDAANAEIASLKDQMAQPVDTSELDAANAEIASLKDQMAQPADTSELDAANAEIAMLKEELAKPGDDNALNAQILSLKDQLANVPAPVDNSAEIMSLTKSAEDNQLKVVQLESELGTVRENRAELEESIALANAERTIAVDRTTELKDRLLSVAGAKNRMEADVAGLQQAVADGEAGNAEKQAVIDDLQAQLESAAAEQAGLAEQQEKLQAQLAAISGERDAAMGKIDVMQANLNRAVDDASAKRKEFAASQSQMLALQSGMKSLESTVASNDSEIARLTKGRSWAMASASKKSAKLGALEADIMALKDASAESDAQLAKVTKGRSAAIKTVTDLAGKLRSAESERNTLAGEKEGLEAQLAKVTKGRSAAITTVSDLARKLRASEQAGAAQAAQAEMLQGDVAAEQDKRKALNARLRNAIAFSKERATQLDSERSRRMSLSSRLRNAIAFSKDRAAQLDGDNQTLQSQLLESQAAMQDEKDQVVSVSSSLADQLSAAGLGNVSVSPVEDTQAVGIVMGSSDLYSVGSASLSQQGVDILGTVGSIVGEYDDWRIDVEGHTDGQPIGSALRAKYESNWELSVARAAAAVRYLQFNTGIPAEKMSVRGFGEYRPIDTNDTSEGREANRRIELILRR